jgi:aerobic-type carbon monoxide dehydrogenase small subunit (CoxS/CutS family)
MIEMAGKIPLRVNGVKRVVEITPGMMLIDLLRDSLELTGAKRGCDNATCGTCVVVMNGRPVKSCNTLAEKASGSDVITVEGLARGMELHPVQRAIVTSGAVQCGFCIPGIVMELYALLEGNPEATDGALATALNKHLCRCTGYEPIRDGAVLARQMMQERTREGVAAGER